MFAAVGLDRDGSLVPRLMQLLDKDDDGSHRERWRARQAHGRGVGDWCVHRIAVRGVVGSPRPSFCAHDFLRQLPRAPCADTTRSPACAAVTV